MAYHPLVNSVIREKNPSCFLKFVRSWENISNLKIINKANCYMQWDGGWGGKSGRSG
jgi:hypothetical protein